MGLQGLQILVIEDAPDLLERTRALTVFRSRHFDVVVSDLRLPDISGDVLIRTGVIFAEPCQWGSVVTHLDGLSLSPTA